METKKALVTGCGRGIGLELIRILLKNKYFVHGITKKISNSPDLRNLKNQFSNLELTEMDISDKQKYSDFHKKVLVDHLDFDIIIHNAATIYFGPIETISEKELQHQFDVNFFAPIKITNLFLPQFRKKQKGHILFLSTTSTFQHQEIYPGYAASKCALDAVAISLAKSLEKWNIKVSSIVVSATKTDIANKSLCCGSAFESDQLENPYKEEILSNLKMLKAVLESGENPYNVASRIFEFIENPKPVFRWPVTKNSLESLEDYFKDPFGVKIINNI